jgi:hypothetical protein
MGPAPEGAGVGSAPFPGPMIRLVVILFVRKLKNLTKNQNSVRHIATDKFFPQLEDRDIKFTALVADKRGVPNPHP